MYTCNITLTYKSCMQMHAGAPSFKGTPVYIICGTGKLCASNKHITLIQDQGLWFGYTVVLLGPFYRVGPNSWSCGIFFWLALIYRKACRI